MKATFFITLLCTFSCTCMAQVLRGDHDISVSWGAVSGRDILDELNHGEDGGGMYHNTNTGNIFLTYRYFVLSRLSVGITAGNQTIKGTYHYDNSNLTPPYDYKLSNTTIAAEVMFIYMNRPGFQSYCSMGIGTSFYNETDYLANTSYYYPGQLSGNKFNFRISPIGFRFGGKFGGFVELGIGYKGLVDGGLYYTIHKQRSV